MKQTFHTPHPLRISVRNAAGEVELACLDTAETEVVVEPAGRDGTDLAERTTVAQEGDSLRVEVPEKRWGSTPKIVVRISAPAGSGLEVRTGSARLECTGRLSRLTVGGASGDVVAESVEGDVEVRVASGQVRLGTVTGEARVGSASGNVTVARPGVLGVSTASGDITVGAVAGSQVQAKTASGDVQVTDASGGTVEAITTSGDITVGVRPGTGIHLEMSSMTGAVRSELPVDDNPPQAGAELEVRLRSVSGSVTVRRAAASAS